MTIWYCKTFYMGMNMTSRYKRQKLSPKELGILKDFAKKYHSIPRLKPDGRTQLMGWKDFSGQQLINYPAIAGNKNWAPHKMYKIQIPLFDDPFDFFRKYVEEHGVDKGNVLQKAVEIWEARYRKVTKILQEQAYELAKRTRNVNDTKQQPPAS